MRPRLIERVLPSAIDGSLAAHQRLYGPLPRPSRRDPRLLDEIAASGLTGRGGAAFPTSLKLAAVARTRPTAVVANGAEGEPASRKDLELLARNPHLVLDGLELAARLVDAQDVAVAVAAGSVATLERAIAERPGGRRPRLVVTPDRFVAGEESAVVNAVAGGPARPTGRRPYASGILVQNVETLAHVALIARRGAAWFREAGTADEPGTALATVAGAVASPGVVEFEPGETLGALLERCGGVTETVDAVLIGGYFGIWMLAEPDIELSDAGLRPHGASLGARAVVALPRSACGLAETARVVRSLADESAGQCGPCVFGLPALADAYDTLLAGDPAGTARQRIGRLRDQIALRGGCAHPDGTLAFAASGLAVFADEIDRHRRGQCSGTHPGPVLPTAPMAKARR
jgi:NADH:ubiquinone oxidoreductase subunit F (NADH-binding)